jgi:GTP cyclohydrolase I
MAENLLVTCGRTVLQQIGVDPDHEAVADTPARYAKAIKDLTSGYEVDIPALFKAKFTDACDEMVVLRGVPFYSLCEHHLLPFFGVAHVAYLPTDKVVGLSKLARLVDAFARRLQLQERLTRQIATALMTNGNAKGAGCVIEARHLCMEARGIEKAGATFTTSSVLGAFRDNPTVRAEFFALVHGR